jgi:3'-phosphoadenosine 5'-phosphosulfate sulfotransferase (PAPS reductase)/FAD synthetase
MAVWETTLKTLRDKAKVSDSCLVAFSGGKDSLAVLDLCRRTFKRVVCFHMYFIPGLKCMEAAMEAAKERFEVEVLYYPHWILFKALRGGVFCNEGLHKESMPDFSLHDIYLWAMKETGVPLLATGAKKADSLWRRRYFYLARNWEKEGVFYPVKEWMKRDVLAYLSARKIPLPDSEAGTATGLDLTTSSLLWLHDRHPDDFKKLCQWFPYAEAVVWRRRFYGIGEAKEKSERGALRRPDAA